MTSTKAPSAGDEIDSRCTKCKGITNHMIIAMVGEQVAKVQCNSCGSRHNYRPPAPPKKEKKVVIGRKAAGSATPKTRQTKASRSRVTLPPLDPEKAIDYTISTVFSVDDVVNHPVFGLGLVTGTTLPNKIEMLFKDGKKIMIGKPNISIL